MRDVRAERSVTTFKARYVMSVDPYGGGVVHRTEVQYQPLTALERRRLELPAIPATPVESRIIDAAGRRLRSKRDDDGRGQPDLVGIPPCTIRIDGEFPRTVQRYPLRALQLRARVSVRWLMRHARSSQRVQFGFRKQALTGEGDGVLAVRQEGTFYTFASVM